MNFVFAFFGQQAEVHRTVNVGILSGKPAEVNGTKPKSLRISPENVSWMAKGRVKIFSSLLSPQRLSMGVFSNDFVAVDVREELCYHSRPEKAKFKRHMSRE